MANAKGRAATMPGAKKGAFAVDQSNYTARVYDSTYLATGLVIMTSFSVALRRVHVVPPASVLSIFPAR